MRTEIKDGAESAQAGSRAAPGSAITTEMQILLNRMDNTDGTVTRHPGGFWYAGNDTMRRSFGTSTVQALVKRGRLEYSEWKQSQGRQFPIKARLSPNRD